MADKESPLVAGAATPTQRHFLEQTLELGLAFLDGSARGGKVLDYKSEAQLRSLIAEPLPQTGIALDKLLNEVRDTVVRHSVAQGDPRYLAFPDTGNAVAGLAADVLTGFMNQNLIAFDRSAPAGTMVEIQLLQWLRQVVGYGYKPIDAVDFTLADVGALWTSGGNMSNHVAVLVALYTRFPQVMRTGLRGIKKRPVMLLAQGIEHFSFASAALSLGLGQDSLVWVKSASDFTTDTEALRETLASLDPGCEPFMVVSVAGNCRTTSIDNIKAMRAVCDEHKVWLHVDACHGGNLLFSEQLRHKLAGIELAQSVSLDPHKGLFVGYPCSYVLFRDPEVLSFVCRYPEKLRDPKCLDLGLIMPFFGSRGFHSLKLWMLIKHIGVSGIGRLIERRQELNDRLVQRLKRSKWFTLLNDGSFYRTAFVFYPPELRKLAEDCGLDVISPALLRDIVNRSTQKFSEMLYTGGEVVFDAFSLADLDNRIGLGGVGKYAAMAMAVGHPEMSAEVEDGIFRAIDACATVVAEAMQSEIVAVKPQAHTHLRGGLANASVAESKGPAGW
jgi:glutamate/tyrosine decarboxylase-like PLP-dependent enzyme